jgi:cobalt-zinc-cadmium efflux system outer membrane protein
MFRRSVVLFLLLGAAGCAKPPGDFGFGDVQSDFSTRTGRQIAWSHNHDDETALANRVDAMLQKPLSVDDAVQVALLNNRRLQATYEQLGIAQAAVMQASSLSNPALDGDVKFPEEGVAHIELSLLVNFVDLLYLPARTSIAQSELQNEKTQITSDVFDVVDQVQRTFYMLVAAEQTLEMRRTVTMAADASSELAQRINQAGNNTLLEVANEQSVAEEAKLNLLSAQTDADDLRERLASLLGLENSENLKIQEKLPDIPANEIAADEVEKQAIQGSLDLAMARDQIELAAKKLHINKPLGMFGDARIGAAYERDVDHTNELGPAFSLPIPLFNQGQPAIAKPDAELRQAQDRYQAMNIEIRSDARSAYKRTIAARQRVEMFDKLILPLHQRIVEETQKQYNAMTLGGFALLQARQMQIEAGGQSIVALRDYWLAKTELSEILAGKLPASRDIFTDRGE